MTIAATTGEPFGHESATTIPDIAEIASPRKGWRGQAVSSFTFWGEASYEVFVTVIAPQLAAFKACKKIDISHVESALSESQPLALKSVDRLDFSPVTLRVSDGQHCGTKLFLLIAAWLVQLSKRKRHGPSAIW